MYGRFVEKKVLDDNMKVNELPAERIFVQTAFAAIINIAMGLGLVSVDEGVEIAAHALS